MDPDEPVEDPDEDYRTMTGQGVLRCELPSRPSAENLANLLRRLAREPQLFLQIVKAAEVGSPLEGTEFIVTTVGEG